MAITRQMMIRALMLGASGLTLTLAAAQPAAAQLTTATIRGQVTTSAVPAAGAAVEAVSVDTGAVTRAVTGPAGSYVLTGLQSGTYDIGFTATGAAKVSRRVIVSVGQTVSLDIDTATATDPAGEDATASDAGTVVVVGSRLVETRTSEVGTNVTQDQIENLPQNNRNFINFAALAPGIRVNQTDFRQTFSGGGVGAGRDGESTGGPQVNVFIDGVSLKSNVNQGGIVGQDVSRGNPFSQLAVKEFRVLSSNFKAEFEDAGTAIITAVTKSGTNEFHGELFGTYQDETMLTKDFFQKQNNQDKPPLDRYQFGGSLGGPIITDRLFFFGSYEANIQDRVANVAPGNPAPSQAGLIDFDPQDYAGSFTSPFREHLGFGKLTYQMTDNQRIELSGSLRKETDNRDFGGNATRERGSSVKNDVYTGKLSHTYRSDGLLNEATVDFLTSKLGFGADIDAGFGLNYPFIQLGGRSGFQTVKQRGLTFRNNLSFTDLHWNGDHLVKVGAKVSFQKYSVGGSDAFNPQFEFVNDPARNLDISQPSEVRFGGGNPNVTAKTTQVGLFVQDDWEVNPHLLLNLGLRWDYDSNAKNNKFVTPPDAVETLLALGANPLIQPAFFDVKDYISKGDRKADLNNFAPRIGFSYDLNADQRTVFFGGYGRYYDRALFRNAAEESLKSQFRTGRLLFSQDGSTRDGQPTIMFQPQYLTPEGFAALLASLATDPTAPGTRELRVIPNNLKTPYTDQFSIGVRQRIGIVRTSLTFNHTVGKDQIGYSPLNRTPVPGPSGFYDYIPLLNGYEFVYAAFNDRATKYDAIFVTADKPYTKASGWGAGIAYTAVLRSKGRGTEFNYDYPDISEQPFWPNAGNEKHRVVANGMVDLPAAFRLSTLITYGSGAPYFIIDANQAPPPDGFKPGTIRLGYFNNLPHFMQVDVRLQKIFSLYEGREITLSADVFNLFNRANFGGVAGNFICCGGGDPSFGKPNSLSGPPRTLQVGAAFRF